MGAVNIIYCHAGQPRGYWIATGKSPRGDFNHSVIYYKDKLFFDPHPDNTGLDGEPKECTILYPLTPSLPRRKPRRNLEGKVREKLEDKVYDRINNKIGRLVREKAEEKIQDPVAAVVWFGTSEYIYDQLRQR